MTDPALGIVADDLSGAAECAVHALMRVSRSTVLLVGDPASPPDPTPGQRLDTVVTVDTDSRRLERDDAVRAVRAAAALVSGAPVVVKKVDSLLRGHLAAEVAALAAELGRTAVVAVANPALDRVVRDGVLHVGGTPLHETDLWAVEPTPAPSRVAEALHPLATVLVPHTVVALGVDAVAAALSDAAGSGLVAVCDAVTERDLEIVHEAATRGSSDVLLVGSGALAAVATRALADQRREPDRGRGARTIADPNEARPFEGRNPRTTGTRSLLLVLGTRAPALPTQLEHLTAARSAQTLLVRPGVLLDDPEAVRVELAGLPRDGVVVVALDPAAPADPTRSRALGEALADAVAPLLDGYDAAFLSGGETARAVLDRLSVHALEVLDEIEPGTVVSCRPGGRLVVTRPGSFGSASSLVDVAAHLLDDPTSCPPEPTHTATRAVHDATTEENS
ncbi:four-carbon acid sugar kinase family protein [Terrabacter carboxydivorans]|uniref:Four-carbon acid sugar kinase family protein n=1 Tax=Terrabacter carboxydivorans TaxID=619730 RepID=A0ABN3M9C5_9MICO